MALNQDVFEGMIIFCEVVCTGGFTAAARKTGHSVSHISKQIIRLENRLGTRLLNRTTRSTSLTESGQMYYRHSQQIVDDAQDAQNRILSVKDKPFGLLRVSVPVSLNLIYFNSWLPEFLDKYPNIKLHIEASDRMVDVISEGYDVVVRIGKLNNTELIAKKLYTCRPMTVASPIYLEKYGMPTHPNQLTQHTLIDFSLRKITNTWNYMHKSGKNISIPVFPRIVCNSAETEVAFACSGIGITRILSLTCQKELESGILIPILEDFEEPSVSVYALYPSRSHLTAKVRVLIDFLNIRFSEIKQHLFFR